MYGSKLNICTIIVIENSVVKCYIFKTKEKKTLDQVFLKTFSAIILLNYNLWHCLFFLHLFKYFREINVNSGIIDSNIFGT